MNIRNLKALLVAFVSLGGFFWAVQNIANLDVAYQSVAYVLSKADHVAYPSSIVPVITSPILIGLGLCVILAGEFAVGLLAAKGAYDLFSARNAPANAFNAAKRFGLLGAGMAMIVWLGIFGFFGGALFQMWQTEIGHGSFADSLDMAIANGIVLLFLNMPDE